MHIHLLSNPWLNLATSALTTAYPLAFPFSVQTHHCLVMVNLLQTSPSPDISLSPNPVSNVRNKTFLPWILGEGKIEKSTYISMLALMIKSTMGIKPSSWITAITQISIPRRATISGITLMHSLMMRRGIKKKRNGPCQRNSQTDFPFGLIKLFTDWQLLHYGHQWLIQLTFLRVKVFFFFSSNLFFVNCWHKLLL